MIGRVAPICTEPEHLEMLGVVVLYLPVFELFQFCGTRAEIHG